MSHESRPLIKGDRVRIKGGMFTGLTATIQRVDGMGGRKKYVLTLTGIICPLVYLSASYFTLISE